MIYSFSGTGNSDYVAQRLRQALGPDDNDELLGIVFPVHAWGIPVKFEGWLEHIFRPSENNTKTWKHVFLVMTCGTDVGYAERTFPYAFDAAYSVQMPNTYVAFPFFDVDDPAEERAKLMLADHRVEQIADRVRRHVKEIDVVRGFWPWLLTYALRPFFVKHLAAPRHLHVDTGRCNGCGKCAKVCPLHNITMQPSPADGHPLPVHGEECCLCSGCYHCCPYKAVWTGPYGKHKGQKQFAKK